MTSIEGPKAATDITKQIITLSTGAVAFTITFLDKFSAAPEGQPLAIPQALYVSWVLFGLTTMFALLNLMGITGTLEAIDRKANGWTMTAAQTGAADGSKTHERWPAMWMLFFFLVAIVAMIVAGFSVANRSAAAGNASPNAAEPVTTSLANTQTTVTGQPLRVPSAPLQLVVNRVEIAAGGVIPTHKHPWSRYVYVESGAIRVTNHDAGTVSDFAAGQAIVEAVDQWHEGRVTGDGPARLIVVDHVPPGESNLIPQ